MTAVCTSIFFPWRLIAIEFRQVLENRHAGIHRTGNCSGRHSGIQAGKFWVPPYFSDMLIIDFILLRQRKLEHVCEAKTQPARNMNTRLRDHFANKKRSSEPKNRTKIVIFHELNEFNKKRSANHIRTTGSPSNDLLDIFSARVSWPLSPPRGKCPNWDPSQSFAAGLPRRHPIGISACSTRSPGKLERVKKKLFVFFFLRKWKIKKRYR